MAIVNDFQDPPDRPAQPFDPEALLLCEAPTHRARLRRYAKAGGLDYPLGVLVGQVDLDLCAAGLIERIPRNYASQSASFMITRAGELCLFRWTQENRERANPHHALGSDLSEWLRKNRNRMTWENVQFEFRHPSRLPPPHEAVETYYSTICRPDVFSMVATLEVKRAAPQVHEIKVSRADFLRDVNDPSKREEYFRMAPQVFYAVPAGLVSKAEVPPECGLWEQVAPGQWKQVKPAPRKKGWKGLEPRQWLALAMKPSQLPE